MKHVAFKKITIVSPTGESGELDYRAYSLIAVKQPLDGKAAGIDEINKSCRLIRVLEEAPIDSEGCDFEDADFEYYCIKVRALKFSFIHPAFSEFIEDVTKEK